MNVLSKVSERGVVERSFELVVRDRVVPGIVWSPEESSGRRPVVLIGHGGTQHKRVPNVLSLGRRLVRHCGYTAIALDAPGHGDRVTDEEAAAAARARLERRIARGGDGSGNGSRERGPADVLPDDTAVAKLQHVAGNEWKAVVDHVESGALDGVEVSSFGYWGVSMGTLIGLPFVASEPRVRAATLGLAGLRSGAFEQAARSLTVPVLFLFQWDDELMTRESGIALFDAIGSKEKTMHVNPGGHVAMPLFERDAVEAFFRRHLS